MFCFMFSNANCYWLLQTSLPGYVVAVTFTFVDIEYSNGCPYDYVQLFDGKSILTMFVLFSSGTSHDHSNIKAYVPS